jgi:hypothetical protein
MSDEKLITYEEVVELLEKNRLESKPLKENDINMNGIKALVSSINIAIVEATKAETNMCPMVFNTDQCFDNKNMPNYAIFHEYVFERFPFMKFEFGTTYEYPTNLLQVDLRRFVVILPGDFVKYGLKFY